jgi:hypothetical protein
MVLGAGMAIGAPTLVEWPTLSPPRECGSEYAKALKRAQKSMAKGDFATAASRFEDALAVRCFEIPNYVLFGPLAEARCRLGNRSVGRELLRDYRCMLEVDAGERPCFVESKSQEPEQQRASGLTDRCFETMCSEIFLEYYENPTQEQLARIVRLSKSSEQVGPICDQEH